MLTSVLRAPFFGDFDRLLTTSGERRKVKARGATGYEKASDLGGEPLLEVYFIDVGQGDGVLIRTPDGKHILIDGGYNRAKQPTGKNAADFMKVVYEHGGPVTRLTHASGYLPGFEPATGKASIKVLAPVEYTVGGKAAFRDLGSRHGQNTNGHSVLLRLDYGRSRILLTGDLNKKSQQLLLDEYEGERTEFLCDVAKGCHHGSDDVSYELLQVESRGT